MLHDVDIREVKSYEVRSMDGNMMPSMSIKCCRFMRSGGGIIRVVWGRYASIWGIVRVILGRYASILGSLGCGEAKIVGKRTQ